MGKLKNCLSCTLFALLAILIVMPSPFAYAANVTLAWDPNTEAGVAGYRVYYGVQSRNYSSNVDVGNKTSHTILNLEPGHYYMAVTAYNSSNQESAYSDEVSYTVESVDRDGDGIVDQDEVNTYHTDPKNADTDGDGIKDGAELAFWGNNWNVDYDGDGLTGLLDRDSDNDGFSDGEEEYAGSDPADANSTPNDPIFSIHNLVAGFGFYADFEGMMEVRGKDYSHEQWLKVNWPDFNAAGGANRVASGDIDGDGKDEIIIGMGPVPSEPSLPGGYFEVLNDDFTHLTWGRIDWADYNKTNGESWPSTGDIDGDGTDEIIIGLGPGGGGWLEIFHYSSGKVVHKDWVKVNWDDYNKLSGETRPANGDIDGDGKDEIVIGLGPVPSEPSLPGGYFEILDDDFTPLAWGRIDWADYNETRGESWPSTGDIDGDGTDEIIAGLGPGGDGYFETFRLSSTTVDHLGWGEINWQDYKDLYGETHPTSADIDFDGKDEIVVGLGKGGDGWIDILDDASQGYALLRSVQTGSDDYNKVSGESWPAVKFSRILTGNDGDKDRLTDEEESKLGIDPSSPDTDGDGLRDGEEFGYGTDPKLEDTDGDGYGDHEECEAGSDPLDVSSRPQDSPTKTTLISPTGIIADNTRTYTWKTVLGSTLYYLWVNDSSGNRIKKWFTAEQSGCTSGVGMCSVTPETALAEGSSKWGIQTWNTNGYGPWSASMVFSVQ